MLLHLHLMLLNFLTRIVIYFLNNNFKEVVRSLFYGSRSVLMIHRTNVPIYQYIKTLGES